jgi:hypothetical protein
LFGFEGGWSRAEVESAYWDNNPGSRKHLPKRAANLPVLTTGDAAGASVTALKKNQRIIVKPALFRLFFLLNELVPVQTEAIMCG